LVGTVVILWCEVVPKADGSGNVHGHLGREHIVPAVTVDMILVGCGNFVNQPLCHLVFGEHPNPREKEQGD
jgi:hypothetical protein